MCGRFTLTYNIDAIAKAFHVAPSIQTEPRYNIAPTQDIVALMHNGEDHLALLRWGLIPAWAKDESIGSNMINARAETLGEKPSFKRLLSGKRCLLVADGFYEWKKEAGGKTPMYITMKDRALFTFAGLWDAWKGPGGELIRTCTIITTQPNDLMASIHNRMPAIIGPEERQEWLDAEQRDTPMLLSLLKPYSTDEMTARPISKLVNNPRNDSAELIA